MAYTNSDLKKKAANREKLLYSKKEEYCDMQKNSKIQIVSIVIALNFVFCAVFFLQQPDPVLQGEMDNVPVTPPEEVPVSRSFDYYDTKN